MVVSNRYIPRVIICRLMMRLAFHQLIPRVFIYLLGSLFLLRIFLLHSRESLGETYKRFHLLILTLVSYFYPLGLYPLLPTRQGTTLPSVVNPNA
jgi:hypothetical protein